MKNYLVNTEKLKMQYASVLWLLFWATGTISTHVTSIINLFVCHTRWLTRSISSNIGICSLEVFIVSLRRQKNWETEFFLLLSFDVQNAKQQLSATSFSNLVAALLRRLFSPQRGCKHAVCQQHTGSCHQVGYVGGGRLQKGCHLSVNYLQIWVYLICK